MCTCTIDIASLQNLSYVYFFFRGPSEFPITARIRGLASPTYCPRSEGLSVYGCVAADAAAVIAVRLAMAGMGPRPPLATSTRGRPHQAAPACRSDKYSPIAVQRSRSSDREGFDGVEEARRWGADMNCGDANLKSSFA